MKNVNTLTNDELSTAISAFYTLIRIVGRAVLSDNGQAYFDMLLMEWQIRIEDGRIERQTA